MLGDIVQLANNLWMIVGDNGADVPNALAYRAGDRLYLLDSGARAPFRASILQVLREVGPVESFTLLNSHSHADHIANNGLIQQVKARETHHYLSKVGLAMLDPRTYFADQFTPLSAVYDPATGYQARRLFWRFVGLLRDAAAVFVGERRALELFFALDLKMQLGPFHPSLETIETYEALPKQSLVIGGVPWTGWVLGEQEVWVLEERGHTPDEVLFYLPEHHLLHTAGLTFPLFPTFPDTNGAVTQAMLRKCHAMASAGAIEVLIDGHHPHAYQGQEAVVAFLEPLFTEQAHFQAVLRAILHEHEGLTVEQVYAQVRQRHDDPVVQHYLALEFPTLLFPLQQIIAVSLLQMGYEARGPRRKQRFYRPASAA